MAKEVVCTTCGHVGKPKRVTKGSLLIEVVLWFAFLIPGLVYSLWRMTSRHDACPKCGNQNLIPKDSPMGTKFLRENFPDKA